MAKKKKKKKAGGGGEGIYVPTPKSDVYLALIILTTLAMISATGIMYYEWSLLQ